MTAPVIDPITKAPNRTDPATYSADADLYAEEIEAMVPQINTSTSFVDTKADEADASAATASAASTTAIAAQDAALSVANFAGQYSTLSGTLDKGSSVFHIGKNWQLLIDLANVILSVPSTANSDWAVINGSLNWGIPVVASGELEPLASKNYDVVGGGQTQDLPSVLNVGDYFELHCIDATITANTVTIDLNGNTVTVGGTAATLSQRTIRGGDTIKLVATSSSNAEIISMTTSNVGLIPTLRPDTSYQGVLPATALDVRRGDLVRGFLGDGDHISLPASASGSMQYFDNSPTPVEITTNSWTGGGIAPSDINGSATAWVGWWGDGTDAAIYTMARNVGATVFYLASIVADGTITPIGSDTPTTAFAVDPTWETAIAAQGTSSIHRAADGSGNFAVRMFDSASLGMEEWIISDSTGLEVTDVTRAGTGKINYITPNGTGVGVFDLSTVPGAGLIEIEISGAKNALTTQIPTPVGLGGSTDGAVAFGWFGSVVLAHRSMLTIINARAYPTAVFNSWVDEYAAILGV